MYGWSLFPLNTDGTVLNLKNKGITDITMVTLSPVINKIYLHSNQIVSIPGNYFSVSSSLIEIHLEGNWIEVVEETTFSNLGNLIKLHLHDNRIHSLTTGCFADLMSLSELTLDRNRLLSLSQDVFHATHHPAALRVTMTGNSLVCDGCILWLDGADWLTVSTTCSSPEPLTGRSPATLTSQDLYNTGIKCPGKPPTS